MMGVMMRAALPLGLFCCLLLVLCPARVRAGEQWRRVPGHLYKQMALEEYCNCIFSTKPIPKGAESSVPVKDTFTSPEPVYARCYFPFPIGQIGRGRFLA